MKVIASFLLILASICGFAQQPLKGTITDKENGHPLAGASVFLNNTSVGTTSNSAGEFSLNVPSGKFDLVVSSIGYQTYTTTLLSGSTPFLKVLLQPKAKELETVIIEPVEKKRLAKVGQVFYRKLHWYIRSGRPMHHKKLRGFKIPGVKNQQRVNRLCRRTPDYRK